MRVAVGCLLMVSWWASLVYGEQVRMQVEWGFGPTPCEMYWDGQVRVLDGQLAAMQAVSFEADRHDRLRPPGFQSFTMNNGTDGLELLVDGQDSTTVRLESRQGDFQWSVGELRRKLKLSFSGKEEGRLDVTWIERLGDAPRVLSCKTTQDSDPAVCRMVDGRQLILWRAFLGLPARAALDEAVPGSKAGGDQICGVVLDSQGQPGPLFDALEAPGDLEGICVVPRKDGCCLMVWAEQRERNWDLYARPLTALAGGKVQGGPVVRLTDDSGVDKSPALAALPDGTLVLAWQGWRGGRSCIWLQRGDGRQWQSPQRLSDGAANEWDPTIAASTDGHLAVASSRWENGSYDVCLRVGSQGTWAPLQRIAASERFEAHPSLVFDVEGTLWIAYEEGQAQWGMDTHTAGLRAGRNVRLSCWRRGRLEALRDSAAWSLPEPFREASEMPLLALDGGGVVWLFFRGLRPRGVWEIYGSSLGETWAEAFTNPSLFEAISQRRCYAATDRIECRMHMGPHSMGTQFTAAEVPPLEIEVRGTAEIERIDVVQDNLIVYCHRPEPPSREARFQFQDMRATPGMHYYYARVIQRDRNMAWLSPIWVEVGAANKAR